MSPSIDVLLSSAGGATFNGHHHVNGVNGFKKRVDGFGTRAIHVGSEPDPSTGAVIPAISLSTTYKQDAIGVHKVGYYGLLDWFQTLICRNQSGI